MAMFSQLDAAEESINNAHYNGSAGQLSGFGHLFQAVNPAGAIAPNFIAFDMAKALRGHVSPNF